jgi:DNA polymerase III alpha subunit
MPGLLIKPPIFVAIQQYYMAAVLSNMSDIKQVSFFMEECKRMGLQVLGPDVNESFANLQ